MKMLIDWDFVKDCDREVVSEVDQSDLIVTQLTCEPCWTLAIEAPPLVHVLDPPALTAIQTGVRVQAGVLLVPTRPAFKPRSTAALVVHITTVITSRGTSATI